MCHLRCIVTLPTLNQCRELKGNPQVVSGEGLTMIEAKIQWNATRLGTFMAEANKAEPSAKSHVHSQPVYAAWAIIIKRTSLEHRCF